MIEILRMNAMGLTGYQKKQQKRLFSIFLNTLVIVFYARNVFNAILILHHRQANTDPRVALLVILLIRKRASMKAMTRPFPKRNQAMQNFIRSKPCRNEEFAFNAIKGFLYKLWAMNLHQLKIL